MDVTIKSIPDSITKKEVCEWVEVLVKRKQSTIGSGNDVEYMKPVTQKAIDDAKKVVEDYKKDNQLTAVVEE